MKYFWVLVLLVFFGCSQKNPRLKIVQESIKVYQNVSNGEDRFGVDAKDKTTVFGEKSFKDSRFCQIYFTFDSYKITSDMYSCIDKYVKFLKKNPNYLTLEGNCDERGSKQYNYNLGLKRAKSVKDVMINSGINPQLIKVISYGKSNPICTLKNQTCYNKNRRVDFVLLQNHQKN